MTSLDRDWLSEHPLPALEHDTDKNRRGRLLAVGGSHLVPGALLLTGEAAYRAGAGKVQLAVPASVSLDLGLRMPEAAVFGLETNSDGELGPSPEVLGGLVGRCDALVLGPGMGGKADAAGLLKAVLEGDERDLALVLDAAAIGACCGFAERLRDWKGEVVLTPHPGEMAALMECPAEEVQSTMAAAASERFGATVLLKGAETWIGTPGCEPIRYQGGGPGLGTGGSGDVLAGIIGGLLARGADASTAAGWGVWAHGEAGRTLAREIAPLGFMAHELLGVLPKLLYGGEQSEP